MGSGRHDPGRRDRILDACLDVVADVGVAGASHRKIAEAADVPLGSMTYHFAGIDELLFEAFSGFAVIVADRFEQRMLRVRDQATATQAVLDILTAEVFTDDRELVITQELYAVAARDARYRHITSEWMARRRAVLELHFDPLTARLVDAVIEGLTLHAALDPRSHDAATAVAAIERITAGDAVVTGDDHVVVGAPLEEASCRRSR